LRSYQYIPWLEAAGIHATTAPLFSDEYVQKLQDNKRGAREAIFAYARRLRALLSSRRFDLLWIEKEALPWLPEWFERALLPRTVPYVLDYDDAVFHRYDGHQSRIVRELLAGKHTALMRGSALVVAGNEYLASFGRSAGARRVEVIPTVVDLTRYLPSDDPEDKEEGLPTVGWIGQTYTARYLRPLVRTLQKIQDQGSARVCAIGINAEKLQLPIMSLPWSEESEVASIRSLDIGIMPIPDEPFERGKCGYKLIQYMACSLPVVASPVGVNCQIVEAGTTGYLADTETEWEAALNKLIQEPSLRRRMGVAGRSKVEREFSLQMAGPRLVSVLRSL
jgi:glycosyltransferase involved in cell wall biosynthesis